MHVQCSRYFNCIIAINDNKNLCTMWDSGCHPQPQELTPNNYEVSLIEYVTVLFCLTGRTRIIITIFMCVGFDSKGCLELNGKVKLTKKWIGTTEAASVFRMLNIK